MAVTGADGRHAFDEVLIAFAAEVGAEGPVCVRGGGTRWSLGGEVVPETREVVAPSGIVAFEPAEMTVRVRAATPVAELHSALADAGQRTSLPERPGGTVGGALMAGESSLLRLGLGPVRDALLQARYVCADGRLATAGAGTVKNVSGFDLCRLLVGSLGTLGLVGEVLLRTLPIAEVERWVRVRGVDPAAVYSACRAAMSILWDGVSVWVLLGGYAVDVDADLARLSGLGAAGPPGAGDAAEVRGAGDVDSVGGAGDFGGLPGEGDVEDVLGEGQVGGLLGAGGVEDVEGPPGLPSCRWSCTPAEAATFGESNGAAGRFVAEIGVGVVHASEPQPPRPVEPGVVELNRRFKERFDPTGRLNPGRDPLRRP